ncbi:MAG TPA: STAS/SEC14 domain-containing protein [Thermoanaerobaculia bacterium]|nr:STAS/SEC14 domain-containing protein [Thermoanaerobaculia bacterium]
MKIIETQLTGTVTVEDVERWKAALEAEIASLPDGEVFALLVNIHGYEPASMEAHKAFRTVVPRTLARHGFRPGFADLLGTGIDVTTERGVTCVAHANVHHDAKKMADYEQKIGRANERFFTRLEDARTWIRSSAFQ